MKRIIIFSVLAITVICCTKNKFKTQPQVQIKSLSPSEVVKGQIFTLRANVTDKEGDLQDSVLFVRKRFNSTTLLSVDTLRYNIKSFSFPTQSEIEIQAQFSYGELKDGTIFENLENADRNLAIGVIVRDVAGHRSDYVESKTIVLKKL